MVGSELAAIREVLCEVAQPPYAHSDLASLLTTLRGRAKVALGLLPAVERALFDTDVAELDRITAYRQRIRPAAHSIYEVLDEIAALERDRERLLTARPLEEYHENMGPVLWHHMPICEPPEVCGSPCDLPEGYPAGWHTHWTPLPDCNAIQDRYDAARAKEAK